MLLLKLFISLCDSTAFSRRNKGMDEIALKVVLAAT